MERNPRPLARMAQNLMLRINESLVATVAASLNEIAGSNMLVMMAWMVRVTLDVVGISKSRRRSWKSKELHLRFRIRGAMQMGYDPNLIRDVARI